MHDLRYSPHSRADWPENNSKNTTSVISYNAFITLYISEFPGFFQHIKCQGYCWQLENRGHQDTCYYLTSVALMTELGFIFNSNGLLYMHISSWYISSGNISGAAGKTFATHAWYLEWLFLKYNFFRKKWEPHKKKKMWRPFFKMAAIWASVMAFCSETIICRSPQKKMLAKTNKWMNEWHFQSSSRFDELGFCFSFALIAVNKLN